MSTTLTREYHVHCWRWAYLLRSERGCAVYVRGAAGVGASIDVHLLADGPTRQCWACQGEGWDDGELCFKCRGAGELELHRCCWLHGEYGDCDGTSLAPVLEHEAQIWAELEAWVP